jgi:hypothetical protein
MVKDRMFRVVVWHHKRWFLLKEKFSNAKSARCYAEGLTDPDLGDSAFQEVRWFEELGSAKRGVSEKI